jgi:hypothetical protein
MVKPAPGPLLSMSLYDMPISRSAVWPLHSLALLFLFSIDLGIGKRYYNREFISGRNSGNLYRPTNLTIVDALFFQHHIFRS